MAYWDADLGTIITFPDRPCPPKWPGWTEVDCSCCVGLEWGLDYPQECNVCDGQGSYCRHEESGALALYPGGPFIGREIRTKENGPGTR